MIATAINFIVLHRKARDKRHFELILDLICLVVLSSMFAGTKSGMTIAMGASAIISTYLYFAKPKFPSIPWRKILITTLVILVIATWTVVLVHMI